MIASDSFNVMFVNDIDRRMGTADILVRTSDIDDDWFDPEDLEEVFDDIDGITDYSFRISGYRVYVSATNDGNQDEDSERTAVYGIDPESKDEKDLGGIFEILDSDVEGDTIEELLDNEDKDTDDRVVVITESLKIKLGKDFEAGDSVWILPVDGEELGYSIYDTDTWIEYTAVAVVRDMGEARDFDPETPSDYSTPSQGPCIFTNIDNAHELVDGEEDVDDDEYNLAVIGVDDVNNVENIVKKLEKKLDEDDWSVADLKTETVEDINASVTTMSTMFMMFALIALILAIILILNIFNIIKEEQEYETGMLQAIGSSKSETFRMFLAQGFIMGVVGAIIGTICSFFVSYLIFYMVIESLKGMPGQFGEYFEGMEYEIILYPQTIAATLAIGVISCVIASIYPSWKASRKPLIECLNPLAQKTEREKKRVKRTIAYILLGIFLISYGSYLIFATTFEQGHGPPSQEESMISMIAPTLTLLGMILLMALAVKPIVGVFIKIFSPYLKQTKLLTKKNVLRHRKRTVLTFSMIALTTSYLVGISVMMGSIQAGADTSVNDIMGCDIRIFTGDTPRDFEDDLRDVDGVDDVMGITHANALIWNEDEHQWFGHEYLEEDWDESIMVHIIDTDKIKKHMTKTNIIAPDDMTLDEMMDDLSEEYTVLVTEIASDELDIDVDDEILVKFSLGFTYPNLEALFDNDRDHALENSVTEELEVIAVVEEIEGFAGMGMIGGQEDTYHIFISWETYEELTLHELPGAGTDIIFKQESRTGNTELDLIQPNWFNFSSVEDELEDVDQIDYYTARMDYATPTQGATLDPLTQVIGIRANDYNNLKSDSTFGSHKIKKVASKYKDLSLEEILDLGGDVCVIDETYYYNQRENGDPNFGVGDYVYIFPQNTTLFNVTLNALNTVFAFKYGGIGSGDGDSLTASDDNNLTYVSDNNRFEFNISVYLTPTNYYKALSGSIESSVNATIDSLDLEAFNFYTSSFDYLRSINSQELDFRPFEFNTDHQYINPLTGELKLRITGNNETYHSDFELYIEWLNFTTLKSVKDLINPLTWSKFQVAAVIKDPKLYRTERYGWQTGYETMPDVSGTENAVYINYEKARELVYVDYAGSDPSNDYVTTVLIHSDNPEDIEDVKDDLEDELENIADGGWSIVDLKTYTLTFRTNVFEWYVWIEEGEDDEEVLENITEFMEDEGYIVGFAFSRSFLLQMFRGFIGLITMTFSGVLIFAIIIAMIGLALHCLLSTMARRREIGMLRSIGLSKKGVIRTISGETLVVAFLGVLIGIIAGLINGALMVFSMPDTGFLSVTFTIPWVTIALLVVVTVVTAIVSSRFPSRWAANINIIDAVRTR